MAVSNVDFTSKIDDWTKQTEERMTAVFRESAQRVASISSNGVPVDTGFARASVRASLSEMPQIIDGSKGEAGQSYPFDMGNVTLTIADAKIGDHIFIGWTAGYVIYLEYGHSKQAPAGFVRLAAEQWPQIVSEVTAEAKSRV
jgi:hypothetical protein